MGIDKSDSLSRYLFIMNESTINSVIANLIVKGPVLKEIVFQLSYLGIQEYEINKIINYFIVRYNQDKLIDIALVLNNKFKLQSGLGDILSGIYKDLSRETIAILVDRSEFRNYQRRDRKKKEFVTRPITKSTEDVLKLDFSRSFINKTDHTDKKTTFAHATGDAFTIDSNEAKGQIFKILTGIFGNIFNKEGSIFGSKNYNYYKIYYVVVKLMKELNDDFYLFDKKITEYQIIKMLINVGNSNINKLRTLNDLLKTKSFDTFDSFVNIYKDLFNDQNKDIIKSGLYERKRIIDSEENIKKGITPFFIGHPSVGKNKETVNSCELVEFEFVSLENIDFFTFYTYSIIQEIKSDILRNYQLSLDGIVKLVSAMFNNNMEIYKNNEHAKSVLCTFSKNVLNHSNAHSKYKKIKKCNNTRIDDLVYTNDGNTIDTDAITSNFNNVDDLHDISSIAFDVYNTPRGNTSSSGLPIF